MKTIVVYCKLNEQRTEIERFPVYLEHIEASGHSISDYTPVIFSQLVKPRDTREQYYKLDLTINPDTVTATWNAYDKTENQIADWDAKALERAKERKLKELQTSYDNAINAGLEINSIVYPIHDKAVEQLNVLLNNFTAQKQVGTYVGTDTKYLIDNNFVTQQVTKDDYLTAIMSIIDYREQLHFNLAYKNSLVASATTIEEVNNITI